MLGKRVGGVEMKNVVLTDEQIADFDCMLEEVMEQLGSSGRDKHDMALYYAGAASGIAAALGITYNAAMSVIRHEGR